MNSGKAKICEGTESIYINQMGYSVDSRNLTKKTMRIWCGKPNKLPIWAGVSVQTMPHWRFKRFIIGLTTIVSLACNQSSSSPHRKFSQTLVQSCPGGNVATKHGLLLPNINRGFNSFNGKCSHRIPQCSEGLQHDNLCVKHLLAARPNLLPFSSAQKD